MPEPADSTHSNFDLGPVRSIPTDVAHVPAEGLGLCLSGGGYRAMLFHLGTLWRLNEFGLLPKVARISSVSGGSITAGVLGLRWNRLAFEGGSAGNFEDVVASKIVHLAQHTIDLPAIGWGMLIPGLSVGEVLVREYDHYLFEGATLQDLPDPAVAPTFVFNSTNLQSLALWRFSRDAMRDWRVGMVRAPKVRLAQAVAASSAFPPVLSPLVLRFAPGEIEDMPGTDLHRPPYTTKVVLSDGGVYDNLGVETVWKNYTDVLVSDAGGKMSPVPDPKGDWALQGLQVLSMGDNQVRNLRKRQIVDSYLAPEGQPGSRKGAYWSVRSDPADYRRYQFPLRIDPQHIEELALEPTRLNGLDLPKIERLINWGYAMCDIALQNWYAASLPKTPPPALPYPQAGI